MPSCEFPSETSRFNEVCPTKNSSRGRGTLRARGCKYHVDEIFAVDSVNIRFSELGNFIRIHPIRDSTKRQTAGWMLLERGKRSAVIIRTKDQAWRQKGDQLGCEFIDERLPGAKVKCRFPVAHDP
ncbi:MAG TPA: hypothetical protein PKE55_01030 [Kiritimatiellia bacterium]|nr:hypothetical protein [Kiritimatiellia bacterium]